MIKQLIFDCDGVLVDSEIIAARVMVELFAKYDIEISLDFYLTQCTGKTFTGLKKEISEKFGKPLPDNFSLQITKMFDARAMKELIPVKGIESVLENSSLPKAVVSNSDIYQIEHAINHVSIAHHFNSGIFSSEMVQNPKPSPDVYFLAAETIKVHPSACLVVEDSKSGATAALEAGMTVIGFIGGSHIMNGHAQKLKSLGVHAIARDSNELLKCIHKFSS